MSEYKNSIQIGIKIDPQNKAETELKELIKKLNKNEINLNIGNQAQEKLSSLSKSLDVLYNKSNKSISLDSLTNSAEESAKVFTELSDQMGKLHEKSNLKLNTKNGLQEAKDVNNALEEQYKLEQQMANIRSKADNNKKQREIQEQNELNKTLQTEQNLVNQIANNREKSELKSKQVDKSQELAQAKAINQVLEDNYKAGLKEADAQKKVQQEIQKQVKLLEIQKQTLNRQYGNKIDTSSIDNAISKLKSMDNINMKDLRNEISNIGVGIKDITEKARSSESILGKLGSSLRNVGIYFDVGDIFRSLINTAKEAVGYVVKIEDSMVSLKRVVDGISTSGFENLQNEIHNMAVSTASSTSDMVETVTDWKKLGYDLQQAKGLAEQSTKFNLAGDVNNIKETTTDLIAIIRGFGIANADAVVKTKEIGDAINQLSNNYAVSSKDLADSMQRSSSALKLAGNSINESLSLATVSQEVNQNSEKVGVGLKTISMRLRGVSSDGEELDAKLGSLVKNSTGVDMTMNGAFRSTYDILHDIAQVWNTGKLDDMTKANLAEKLFGKNQATVGIAILENFKQLESTMKSLEGSAGSVEKEFARSMDSTSAKVKQLKENVGGIFSQFVNSDMTKGVVSGLNSFVVASGNVIKTLGVIPTVIATVVGSLTIFNSKFRESMSSYQPSTLTNYTNNLKSLSSLYKDDVKTIQDKIIVQKAEISTQNTTGTSYISSRAKLLGLQGQLITTTVAEKACAIGAQALGVAFNMALGLGIGFVIQGLSEFANSAETARQKSEELLSSIQTSSQDLTSLQSLKDEYENLSKKIEENNLTTSEASIKKQELHDKYSQLISQYPSLASALQMENGEYEANISTIDRMIKLKEKEIILNNQKYLTDNKVTDSGMKKQLSEIEQMTKEIEGFNKKSQMSNEELKASGDLMWFSKSGDSRREYFKQLKQESQKELLDVQKDLETKLAQINKSVELTGQSPVSSEVKQNLEETLKFLDSYGVSLEDNTKKTNENTGAKKENANVETGAEKQANAIKSATEEYAKSTQVIAQAQIYLDKLNKSQSITPALVKQMSKAYGSDVTESLNSASKAQEYLTTKIQEQQTAQQDAYAIMKQDDESFYSDKIKNNDAYSNQINSFLNAFVTDSNGAYNVDLGNYTTLNGLKSGAMQQLSLAVDSWMSQYVDVTASGYNVDYNNFTTLVSAKSEILKQFAGSMAQFWDSTSQAFTEGAYGGVDLSGGASTEEYQAFENRAKSVLATGDKIRSAYGSLDKIYAGGGLNLNSFGGGMGASDFSGSGGSGGSGGSDKSAKEAEKAQKLAEDIARLKSEIEPDRYLDFNNAIKQVDNELNLNKGIKDTLKKDSPEYQSALEKDIKLYKDKQVALNNLNEEQKKEQSELKTKLANLGFEFDATGKLINSQKTLLDMQEKVNAMGGNDEDAKQAKQDAIKNLKEINDETKKYIELNGDKIPKVTEEWESLNSEIKKTNDEMKETLGNFRDKIAGYKLKELQEKQKTAEEDLESAEKKKKKALEDAKKAKSDELEAQIKFLQDQIKALDDESADNEKKLAKLKAERQLWLKDDSVFSKSKIADLDTKIKETEKTIKKDNLNKQIDKLQEEKDASNREYDKDLSDLDDYYEKKKKKQEKSDNSAKLEEKAYKKADKLLKGNHQKDIIKLMEKYGESYKDVGKLLGENFKEGWIAQIKQAKEEYTSLMGNIDTNSSTTSKSDSSSSKDSTSSNSGSSFTAKNGDHVWIENASSDEIYADASHNSSKGTGWSNGVASSDELIATGYENGFMRISDKNGNDLGFVENSKLKKFATGGRIGKVGSQGVPIIADDDEMIANAGDTKKFDEMHNYIMNSGALISQLSNQQANPSSYSLPNLVGTNLNGIANNVTNTNSTDNSVTQPIQMNVNIVNEKGSESFTEQKLFKVMNKWQKEQGRIYR